MKLKQVYLIDSNPALVEAWREAFKAFPEVKVVNGDFFATETDAIVSPANSFGIMDGGLDLAIRDQLGFAVETKVQQMISRLYHGELSVGSAEVVDTDDERWPFLVCAPTMRVPTDVSRTLNSYLSFRAALLAIRRHNETPGAVEIETVSCPGMGTGVGSMNPRRCAAQMRVAYMNVLGQGQIPPMETIHEVHMKLLTV